VRQVLQIAWPFQHQHPLTGYMKIKNITLILVFIVTGCSAATIVFRAPTKLNEHYWNKSFNYETLSRDGIAIAGVFVRDDWSDALKFEFEYNDMLMTAIESEHPGYNLRQVMPQPMEISSEPKTISLVEKIPVKFFEPSLLGLFDDEEIYLRYLIFAVITRNTKEKFSEPKDDDDECFFVERQIDIVAQVFDTYSKTVVWHGKFKKDITHKRCVSKCDSDAEGFFEGILEEFICELTRVTYPDPPPVESVLIPIFKMISGKLPYEGT